MVSLGVVSLTIIYTGGYVLKGRLLSFISIEKKGVSI